MAAPLLDDDDRQRVTSLLDRTGLLTRADAREALLIEIGVNAAEISLDADPHTSAVLLVNRLVNVGNEDALRRMLRRISARIPSGTDIDLTALQGRFGIDPSAPQTGPETSAPAAESGEPVAKGLMAFRKLMNDSRIREAASTFKAVFETARSQIREVTGYKGLHDRLHDLQDKVVGPMEKAAPDFPADPGAEMELDEYRIEFENINQQLRTIAGSFSSEEAIWADSVDALDGALSDYRAALHRSDVTLLNNVIKRLQRQLTLRLPEVNARLNAAAAALRLEALVQALNELIDYASELKGESELLRQFREGVEALDRMHKNLRTLLWRHDVWQDFDSHVRAMEKDLADLSSWWPDVERLVARLTPSYGEVPWMVSFRADYEKLATALQSGQAERVSHTFRLLRRHVGKQFYNTDADLKNQCDEFNHADGPLTKVLRVIE